MIKNGRPYSCENHAIDDGLITDKPKEIQDYVIQWITNNIYPRKSENTRHTSYGIKHILQYESDIYLTNNEFKDAMMICGFMPVRDWALNWTYCISERAPAFRKNVRGAAGWQGKLTRRWR